MSRHKRSLPCIPSKSLPERHIWWDQIIADPENVSRNWLGVWRTKLPPKKPNQLDTKNHLKTCKRSEKRSETCPNKNSAPSYRLKLFHRHFSKSFSPPKVCTNRHFNYFTTGVCRCGHAKKEFLKIIDLCRDRPCLKLLIVPAIFRLCSSSRANYWNQSDRH